MQLHNTQEKQSEILLIIVRFQSREKAQRVFVCALMGVTSLAIFLYAYSQLAKNTVEKPAYKFGWETRSGNLVGNLPYTTQRIPPQTVGFISTLRN